MLTSNEKKLLYILGVVLAVCATGLFFFLRITMQGTGLNALNKEITEIEDTLRRLPPVKDEELLSDIENIEQQIKDEKSRFYSPGETDIATFGLRVKNLLTRNRLKIPSQKTITLRDINFIEFSCEGRANNLTQFLKDVSTADKHWRIDSLLIQSKTINGNINAKLRITYETIDTDNN